jgi:hypothetical protein
VILGFALHGFLLPVFLASGLVVPVYVMPALVAMWAGFLVVAIRFRRRPGVVVAVPVAALAALILVVTIGGVVFGWTA